MHLSQNETFQKLYTVFQYDTGFEIMIRITLMQAISTDSKLGLELHDWEQFLQIDPKDFIS